MVQYQTGGRVQLMFCPISQSIKCVFICTTFEPIIKGL